MSQRPIEPAVDAFCCNVATVYDWTESQRPIEPAVDALLLPNMELLPHSAKVTKLERTGGHCFTGSGNLPEPVFWSQSLNEPAATALIENQGQLLPLISSQSLNEPAVTALLGFGDFAISKQSHKA